MSELNLQINMDEPVQLLFISDALRSIALHQGADASLLNGVKTTVTHQAGDMSVTKTVEAIVTPRDNPFYWYHSESDSFGFVETESELFDLIASDPLCQEINFDRYVELNNASKAITPPTLDELAVNDMDEALAATTNNVEPPVTIEAPEIPWDARIHSKNKTTNADGSFKMRKKPADQTKEQWTSYVEAVKVELKQLMNPVTQLEGVTPNGDVVADSQDPSSVFSAPVTETPPVVVTPPVVTETPPVVVTPPVVTETPPVVVTPPVVTETPSVVVTPPVVTETPPVVAEGDQPKTFGELMKFVTTNKVKLTPDACNEVLKAHGIEKWPLLATKLNAQPDFMNTIYPALKALL